MCILYFIVHLKRIAFLCPPNNSKSFPKKINSRFIYGFPIFIGDLKKILSRLDDPDDGTSEAVLELVMEKLQPLITAANIAVDECDFGNSIELGIDLFCSGSPRLHAIVMQLLATGYSMVQRPQLIAILKVHFEIHTMYFDGFLFNNDFNV